MPTKAFDEFNESTPVDAALVPPVTVVTPAFEMAPVNVVGPAELAFAVSRATPLIAPAVEISRYMVPLGPEVMLKGPTYLPANGFVVTPGVEPPEDDDDEPPPHPAHAIKTVTPIETANKSLNI